MKKIVHVIGNEAAYMQMFLKNGWDVVGSPDDAEFIQFTGGADVSPMLYGETKHPTTYSNPKRDEFEAGVFDKAVNEGKNLLGICRGSQFLNVMCGGSLWQNVNNHAIRGTHPALDLLSGNYIDVSSTHHQMMIPDSAGEVVATAQLATIKESDELVLKNSKEADIEVVWYGEEKALCFQPHPEFFQPDHPCQEYYFDLIDRFFGE